MCCRKESIVDFYSFLSCILLPVYLVCLCSAFLSKGPRWKAWLKNGSWRAPHCGAPLCTYAEQTLGTVKYPKRRMRQVLSCLDLHNWPAEALYRWDLFEPWVITRDKCRICCWRCSKGTECLSYFSACTDSAIHPLSSCIHGHTHTLSTRTCNT